MCYASQYLDADERGPGRLNGAAAVLAAAAYQADDVTPVAERRELADHVTVELEFLFHLCRREEHSWAAGERDEALRLRRVLDAFLREHASLWLRGSRRPRAAGARGPFAGMAELLTTPMSWNLARSRWRRLAVLERSARRRHGSADVSRSGAARLRYNAARRDPRLCVATRYRSSSCRRCLDVCPAAAITTSPWLQVNAERCRSCGACAAVCPTGALVFAPGSFGSDVLRAAFASDAAAAPASTALACRRADPAMVEGAVRVMPCLGGVSARDLIAAAALGIEKVVLISGDCVACPNAVAEAALDTAVTVARTTLAALCSPLVVVRERLPGCTPGGEAAAAVSRRHLLGYLVHGLERTVAEGIAPSQPERSIITLHKQMPPPPAHRRLVNDLTTLKTRRGGSAVILPITSAGHHRGGI